MKNITKDLTLWIYRESGLPDLVPYASIDAMRTKKPRKYGWWNAYRKRVRINEKHRLLLADRILSIFKIRALRTPKPQRIALLKELAEYKIERRCMSKYWISKMRSEFEQVKHKIKLKGQCWVCDSPAELRHHIIQLQNGGRNIERNIVLLCCDCHAEIHPWLK